MTRTGPTDLAAIALLALIPLALAACQPTVAAQGRDRNVDAAYQFRTLSAKLDPTIQVLTVSAAAEQTLRARGYTVTRASATADTARVSAKRGGSSDTVVIESWLGDRFTGVSVTCEPWGDQATSRALLDGVLNRLGR